MGSILFFLEIKVRFLYLIYEAFLDMDFLISKFSYTHVRKAFPSFFE